MSLILYKKFSLTNCGIINEVPKEKYSYTLKPWNLSRNVLNLGAKDLTFMLMRLKSQNEAAVAMQKNSTILSIYWSVHLINAKYFKKQTKLCQFPIYNIEFIHNY